MSLVSVGNANDKDKIWYFSSEQLANSPSRRCGIDPDQELFYRQMTAYLIQEMGQRMQVSQLCINTAIVYMHRFYAFHSFTHFHRNSIAAASLFLAAKVEEQPRKLEHVIKAANKCLAQTAEVNYMEQAQDLVFNENVLLQTLGFDVAIDHPHTHVVRTCHLVKACKDLAQTSYFLASNSLHLTSMCLQYRPTVVACFCIYLACKWSRWEIPQSIEGRQWFYYVDESVTLELLKQLTDEFIAIYEKSPARLKSKLNSIKAIAQGASNRGINKEKQKEDFKMGDIMKGYHSSINTNERNGNAPPSAYSSYSSGGTLDGSGQNQQAGSVLLPPPSQPVPQQQQMRKSDMHSSQHRSHHGSSSSSSSASGSSSAHHHQKSSSYAGDPLNEHKSKSQNAYAGGMVNRSSSASGNVQRSGVMPSSRGPSASSSGTAQRVPTQGHPMDYHKSTSRDRNGIPIIPGAHGLPAHKMASKQLDANSGRGSSASNSSSSSVSKDVIGMPINKQSGINSSKMYHGALATAPPPPYASSNSINQTNKMDMLHSQRPYVPGSNNNAGQQPLNSSNNSIGGNNSSSNSSAAYHHRKSSVHASYEQLPPPYQQNVRTLSDQQQSEQEHNSQPSMQQLMTKGSSIASASLFSPDFKEKQPHHNLNGYVSHDYKLGAHSRDKDSPKKERNSSSSTPTKKDRNRMAIHPPSSSSLSANIVAALSNNNVNNALSMSHMKSATTITTNVSTAQKNELAGTSQGGALKRLSDTTNFAKPDDDSLHRDSKMRKLDITGSTAVTAMSFGSYENSSGNEIKHPIAMTNGMETTPDLVRSLLKESLCTTNALLKAEPLTMPGLKPPAELLEPSASSSNCGVSNNSNSNNNNSSNYNNYEGIIPNKMTDDGAGHAVDDKHDGGSKSEKKKKKDKHKHKEKDKMKHREERKKHKKDKDKEKHKRDSSDNMEHVRLVIPKEKLETSGGDLKLKIPKERLKTETAATTAGSLTNASGALMPLQTTTGLKIKIPKDVIENYNNTSYAANSLTQDHMQLQQVQMNLRMYGNMGNNMLGVFSSNNTHLSGSSSGGHGGYIGGGSSSSSNNKKKERDKDKKRSSHDNYMKYNGQVAPTNTASVAAALQMASAVTLSTLTTTATLPAATATTTNTIVANLGSFGKK